MPLIQSFPPVDGQTVQAEVLPTAGAAQLDKIYQYVGTTTPQYVNGYYYKCVYNNPNYEWVNVLVQPEANPDPSVILTGTILANGWNNNAQTVTVNNFDPSTPGTIGLLNTVTGEQYAAAANAGLRATAIANNSVTFSCEETPEIDIPFGILIPGTTVDGGGGTTDYTYLDNKPQIANVTLQGNKSLADLGIASASDVETALATKVDKVNGKGLSANDYTDEDKTIVSGVTSALADKVDKVVGKGLSTNDYTNEDKTIVDGISTALADKVDKVAGKGLSTNDYTNEDKAIVGGITSALAGKQDTISDLATIRSGASAGASAIQPSATEGLLKNDGTVDTVLKASQAALSDSEKDIYAVMGEMGAKNLIPYPYDEASGKDNRGVVFTYGTDGIMYMNGTSDATNQPFFTLASIALKASKPYALYCDSDNEYVFTIIYFRNSDNTAKTITYEIEYSDGTKETRTSNYISLNKSGTLYKWAKFTLSDNSARTQIDIRVVAGSHQVNNAYGKVMLIDGRDTDLTWKIFAKTNKQLTDEIANKVDKVEGKGLSTNDYDNTEKAEVAKVAGKAEKTTTASGEALALAPTSEGKALIHTVYGMSVQNGTPTPSVPVDIESAKADFRSVGKNLLSVPYKFVSPYTPSGGNVTFTTNSDNTITTTVVGVSTGSACDLHHYNDVNYLYLPNGRYILTGCPVGGDENKYFIGVFIKRGNKSAVLSRNYGDNWGGYPEVFEINGDDYSSDGARISVNIIVKPGIDVNGKVFKPMIRLASVSDATYEPYKKTDITTNLTLRAIEVSSTDNYNLVRDNKYYIADTLDYSEDSGFVVTRRIKHNEWDENEDWVRYSTTGRDTYYVTKNDAKPNIKSYCNLFNMMSTVTTSIGEGFIHTNHGVNFNYSGQGESTLNDWLSFVENNHIKIDYILETPTTESITTEQALALLSLKTYDESTSISSQAEPSCTVAIEYAKERLAAVALTSYLDLATKANITDIPAPQIQADWNQSNSSALDFIKNKPTIPSPQIQSDWNQSDSAALDFIKNKPVIPAGLPPLPIDGWFGLASFSGNSIWTDGTNIYYSYSSNQYVLDKSTLTWTAKTWNGLTSFGGNSIWTDGDNIYFSQGSDQYVLDKSTSTWTVKTWNEYSPLTSGNIWTDGTEIYYSGYSMSQRVLDKSTSTWNTKTWNGFTNFNGPNIWTDGDYIYYSQGSDQYVLDKSTSTWTAKTWNGVTSYYGDRVWSDSTNIYYSSGGTVQYVLDKSTSTWNTKTWNGLNPDGRYIWTNGTNIYYSNGAAQYALYKDTWYPMSGRTTEENYITAVLTALNPTS